jgi:hypothetical protein
MKVFSIVFLLIGLTMLGIGGWLANESRELRDTGDRVPAVIVSSDSSTDSEGDTTYSPVYAFTYRGEERTHTSSVSSSSQPTIGEAETLYVDPDDPTTVKADSFMDMWFLPALLGGMGIVFTAIGLFTGIGALVFAGASRLRGRASDPTAPPLPTPAMQAGAAANEQGDETGTYTGSGTTGPFVGDDRNQNQGPFL